MEVKPKKKPSIINQRKILRKKVNTEENTEDSNGIQEINEDVPISKPVDYNIDTMEVSQMSSWQFTPSSPDHNIPTNTNNNINNNEDKKDIGYSSGVEQSSQSNTSF